jgi:hypothetical protein
MRARAEGRRDPTMGDEEDENEVGQPAPGSRVDA